MNANKPLVPSLVSCAAAARSDGVGFLPVAVFGFAVMAAAGLGIAARGRVHPNDFAGRGRIGPSGSVLGWLPGMCGARNQARSKQQAGGQKAWLDSFGTRRDSLRARGLIGPAGQTSLKLRGGGWRPTAIRRRIRWRNARIMAKMAGYVKTNGEEREREGCLARRESLPWTGVKSH